MCSASIGSLVLAKENEKHGNDIIVTQTVGAQGTFDRYLMNPAQKQNMTIIKTEKCATGGGGETHIVCRGAYGQPRAPWGTMPLMSRHLMASSQDMDEVSTKLQQLAQLVRQAPHGGAARSAAPTPASKRPRMTGANSTPVAPRPASVVVVPPSNTILRPLNPRAASFRPPGPRATSAPRPPLGPKPPLPKGTPRQPLPRQTAAKPKPPIVPSVPEYNGVSTELDTTSDVELGSETE